MYLKWAFPHPFGQCKHHFFTQKDGEMPFPLEMRRSQPVIFQ